MSRGPAGGRGRPPAGGQLLGEGGPNGRAFAGGRGGGGGGAVAPLVGVAAARDATSGGWTLQGLVASPDGRCVLCGVHVVPAAYSVADAAAMGYEAGEELAML